MSRSHTDSGCSGNGCEVITFTSTHLPLQPETPVPQGNDRVVAFCEHEGVCSLPLAEGLRCDTDGEEPHRLPLQQLKHYRTVVELVRTIFKNGGRVSQKIPKMVYLKSLSHRTYIHTPQLFLYMKQLLMYGEISFFKWPLNHFE